MKKLFRALLCGAILTAALSVTAFAEENPPLLIAPAPSTAAPAARPELQGDFYVLVNGEYVTFTDAVPKIKNDRSCLPFVAVFEQLGFPESAMTWDHDTKTVTATKGDLTVSLTIGKNEIVIIKGGETTVIPTDVAPYIEPALSRTYIPFGLVADALHYAVGWDANVRAVIIDDVDAIMEANTETYDLMDKYMAYAGSFYSKNQQITGSYASSFVLSEVVDGELLDMEFLTNGTYTARTDKNFGFDYNSTLDLSMQAYLDGANITKSLKDAGELPELSASLTYALRGNLKSGDIYVHSPVRAELVGDADTVTDAWYKVTPETVLTYGNSYTELLSASARVAGTVTFEEYLTQFLKDITLSSVDATTADILADINAVVGDSAFVKNGKNYVSDTYLYSGDVLANTVITLTVSGSNVTGYSISAGATNLLATTELKMEMQGSSLSMTETATMLTSGTSMVTTETKVSGTCKTSSKVPETLPPAGATVIDATGI